MCGARYSWPPCRNYRLFRRAQAPDFTGLRYIREYSSGAARGLFPLARLPLPRLFPYACIPAPHTPPQATLPPLQHAHAARRRGQRQRLSDGQPGRRGTSRLRRLRRMALPRLRRDRHHPLCEPQEKLYGVPLLPCAGMHPRKSPHDSGAHHPPRGARHRGIRMPQLPQALRETLHHRQGEGLEIPAG